MEKEIKIYDVLIDGDDLLGVNATALVYSPAIQEEFIKLKENKQLLLSQIDDKQLLVGPLLIPDKKIYRRDEETNEEYLIVFSKETIQKIVLKYFKENKHINFNIEHKENEIEGVVIESWIIEDKENDKSNMYGFDLPVGTWMVMVHIPNKEHWDKYVKSGEVRGFSIEGNFNLKNINLVSTSNTVIIVEYDDLNNQKLLDYLGIRQNINRIIVFSDTPGVTKSSIRNKYGIYVDEVLYNSFGRDLKSKIAYRGVKIVELENKYSIINGITSDHRIANIYKNLNIRTTHPTRLSISTSEAKELLSELLTYALSNK